MKIANGTIMNPNFIMATEKLLKKELSVKQCLQLAQSIKALNDQLSVINKSKIAIAEKYSELDDKGQIKTENSVPVFKSAEARKEYMEKVIELAKEEVEIPLEKKIKIGPDEKLTTEEFVALEDIIEIG